MLVVEALGVVEPCGRCCLVCFELLVDLRSGVFGLGSRSALTAADRSRPITKLIAMIVPGSLTDVWNVCVFSRTDTPVVNKVAAIFFVLVLSAAEGFDHLPLIRKQRNFDFSISAPAGSQ